MCRSLISVDWKGYLYNCDFNQAVQLGLFDCKDGLLRIGDLERTLQKGIPIQFSNHCFACTAGEGSSCFGQLGTTKSGQDGVVVENKGESDQLHRSEH